jgi:hypothetical protein
MSSKWQKKRNTLVFRQWIPTYIDWTLFHWSSRKDILMVRGLHSHGSQGPYLPPEPEVGKLGGGGGGQSDIPWERDAQAHSGLSTAGSGCRQNQKILFSLITAAHWNTPSITQQLLCNGSETLESNSLIL